MNFFDYIGVPPAKFESEYIDLGFVQRQKHKQFPLDIFTYTRKTVHENLWDGVTSRCRGIVINRETGEIIARPFEKFHNYGSPLAAGLSPEQFIDSPVIWEKVDGFMCTLYRWEGQPYIASKGSFTSIHAKWDRVVSEECQGRLLAVRIHARVRRDSPGPSHRGQLR